MSMAKNFDNLRTEIFRKKLRPAAIKIYHKVWPGCEIQDLRTEGIKVHILDKEFGIDTLTTFKSGQWISIQEKYRSYARWSKYKDFTQEYKNADGTIYESPGEWFHLGAQLYFCGWANKSETDFQHWFLMDIAKYKLTIEKLGGLGSVGILKFNEKHGKASFYAIPIETIKHTFLITSKSSLTCHV